jgi:hypothetical protein
MRRRLFVLAIFLALTCGAQQKSRSWTAGNGNGTYSNPVFCDEFPDPDIIRVGSDYYLTGTTMHTMPGLPILHSRDLVNWRFLSYAFDRLEKGLNDLSVLFDDDGFASYGSRENGATTKTNAEDLKKTGITAVFYESPVTAHEWLGLAAQLARIRALLFQK